ncbi:hypothetical protein R3P38DRAFT_3225482 [Favolaschia claudopus]|uniref:Uncharacterized protein n=1 Tax=Favolaschia claudopus TaxID=2862362 RepID=A0AAV9ZVX7_9AGAR
MQWGKSSVSLLGSLTSNGVYERRATAFASTSPRYGLSRKLCVHALLPMIPHHLQDLQASWPHPISTRESESFSHEARNHLSPIATAFDSDVHVTLIDGSAVDKTSDSQPRPHLLFPSPLTFTKPIAHPYPFFPTWTPTQPSTALCYPTTPRLPVLCPFAPHALRPSSATEVDCKYTCIPHPH